MKFDPPKEPVLVTVREASGPWVQVEVDSTMTGEDFARAYGRALQAVEHPKHDPTLFPPVPGRRKEKRGKRQTRRPPGAP